MRIKAVTFDVGGTLIEPWPSVGHVYAEVAAKHGVHASAETLSSRFKAAWNTFKPFENSRVNWSKLVDEAFRGLCAEPPSTTFFPELYERFADPSAWRVFDDVFPALDTLAAAGLRLGVISNWDERLRRLLHGLRLEKHFETFTISCEVGASKPSPLIFRHAAEQFRLAPEAIAHVGDSLEMDIQGAQGAGFQAFRIFRSSDEVHACDIRSLSRLAVKIRDLAQMLD